MAPAPDEEQQPNVVHPEVLEARRRVKQADLGPEAAMELRAFEAERRLVEVATERDRLREELLAARDRGSEDRGRLAARLEAAEAEVAQRTLERDAAQEAARAIAAERDRARAAVDEERERAAAAVELERERAAAAVEAEKARAAAAEAERDRALEAATTAVERDRAQRPDEHAVPPAAPASSPAPADDEALAALHASFAVQVGALEGAVALVRDRLVGAVRALRRKLDAERDARERAEATVSRLHGELLLRERAEAELRQALDALRREPSRDLLAARLEELARTAGALREGVTRQDDLVAALAAMDARVEALQARLREQVEAERAARADAEAELEVERRRSLDDRRARSAVEAELAAERERSVQDRRARTAAEAEVAEARRRADEAAGELERRVAEATASASERLQALEAEVADLRARESAAIARAEELERELSELRSTGAQAAARIVALESELAAADAVARDAEARLAAREAELAGARAAAGAPASVADSEALASLRETLDRLRTEPAPRPQGTVATDLAAAAERLRAAAAAVEQSRADETEAGSPAGEPSESAPPAGDLAAEPSASADPVAEAPAADEPVAEPSAADDPAADEPVAEPSAADDAAADPSAADDPAAEPPVTHHAPPVDLAAAAERLRSATALEDLKAAADQLQAVAEAARREEAGEPPARTPADRWDDEAPSATSAKPLLARDVVGEEGPWLRDALLELAAEDAEAAERVLVGLLAVQAALVRKPLAYAVSLTGGRDYLVALEPGKGRVTAGDVSTSGAKARLVGPLEALVPLGAGGADRKLAGVDVKGRRHVRKLLRARRKPVALAEVARARALPDPLALLRLLVPRATAERTLRLELDLGPEGRLAIAAEAGGPITVGPDPFGPPPTATVRTTASALPAILAGTAPDGAAEVEGDSDQVTALLAALDRARLARG